MTHGDRIEVGSSVLLVELAPGGIPSAAGPPPAKSEAALFATVKMPPRPGSEPGA